MTNLKHKLRVLALCVGGAAFLGGPLLADVLPKPKAAVVAINEAKIDKDFFSLIKESFAGSLKSKWGLKVVDNALTNLALKSVGDNLNKVKAAGKLLSMDYICVIGTTRSEEFDGSGLKMVALLFDAPSGDVIGAAARPIDDAPSGNEVVRQSKALAAEMDKAIKKKMVSDKASAIKDLVKR